MNREYTSHQNLYSVLNFDWYGVYCLWSQYQMIYTFTFESFQQTPVISIFHRSWTLRSHPYPRLYIWHFQMIQHHFSDTLYLLIQAAHHTNHRLHSYISQSIIIMHTVWLSYQVTWGTDNAIKMLENWHACP